MPTVFMSDSARDYQVAFSYASEDRAYVESVASALRAVGVSVFYDQFETASLWGKDLYDELRDIYSNRAHFCVMFVSEHYVKKSWTSHERQSAQARAIESSAEYILPVRFDQSKVPGLNPNLSYLDLTEITPQQLALQIVAKLELSGVFGQPRLRTVSELTSNLAALQAELEAVNSDPDFQADDPLRHMSCPKCGERALTREWNSGGRSGAFQVADVRCPRCGFHESGFSTPDFDLVRSKYPDARRTF